MPPFKPDNLKLLSGTLRKDRARKNNTPAGGIPPCPKDLSDGARKEWKRVAKLLNEAGLLSRLDMAALDAYASAWELWRKAEAQLKDDDLLLQAGNGLQYANPLIVIAGKARASMLSWAKELGLTPASRQKLPTVPPRPVSKLDKYLRHQAREKEIKFFGDVA